VNEEKYDRWRMIAYKEGSLVRLISRNNVDHIERFRQCDRRTQRTDADPRR